MVIIGIIAVAIMWPAMGALSILIGMIACKVDGVRWSRIDSDCWPLFIFSGPFSLACSICLLAVIALRQCKNWAWRKYGIQLSVSKFVDRLADKMGVS